MHTYIQSEPGLWTVGHYDPQGKWQPESDHGSTDAAAARVHFLNGGNPGLLPIVKAAREVLATAICKDHMRQASARMALRDALRAAGFQP